MATNLFMKIDFVASQKKLYIKKKKKHEHWHGLCFICTTMTMIVITRTIVAIGC